MFRLMSKGGHNQLRPVAMPAEGLRPRWTVMLVRERAAGSTRFNDLRRGLPRMSPALLSKRLKIVPAALADLMSSGDAAQTGRVMKALLQMKKLDLAELKRAYEGKQSV